MCLYVSNVTFLTKSNSKLGSGSVFVGQDRKQGMNIGAPISVRKRDHRDRESKTSSSDRVVQVAQWCH
jgi:hypothetical protein